MKLPAHVFASLCLLCVMLYPAARSFSSAYNAVGINQANLPANEDYSEPVAKPEAVRLKLTRAVPRLEFQTESRSEQELIPGRITAQPVIASKARFDQMVAEVALVHGLDSALLHAVISVESRYNPNAVSRAGAVGLMQLMPATAKRYGVKDSFDPAQNLHGGAKYLRDLLTLFDSDINLVLAAYNAGEYAVIKNGNRIPPFPETRKYVPRVMGYYHQYQVKL